MNQFFDILLSGDVQKILEVGGIVVLLLMIFFESGIIFGIIFPGDGLLFTAGILAGSDILGINIYILLAVLVFVATAGNVVGYWTGKSMGRFLKKRKKVRFLKPEHIEKVQEFYEKYGPKSFIVAKFFPVVRTLLPILAGTINVPFKGYVWYSFLGSCIRVGIFLLLGNFLGNRIPNIVNYIEYIILAIVVLANATMIYKWIKYVIEEKILKRINLIKKRSKKRLKSVFSSRSRAGKKTKQLIQKNKFPFKIAQTLKSKKPGE